MSASARSRISSSRAGAPAGVVKASSSTLSNSCTRSRPRVSLPAAPGLPAVAGGGGGEPHGEVGLLEHLVDGHGGERHLGGGDGPQVVALDVVRLVGELRQLPGGGQAGAAHEGGRAHLLEGVAVAVEGPGGEGPEQPGARCPGRAGTSSRRSWPPDRGRGSRARRRSPSGGRAGGARRRRRRSPPPGRRRCPPRPPRRARRATAGWGCAAAGRGARPPPPPPPRPAPAPPRRGPGSRPSWPRPRPPRRRRGGGRPAFESCLTAARSESRRSPRPRRRSSRAAARSTSAGSTPLRARAGLQRLRLGAEPPDVEHRTTSRRGADAGRHGGGQAWPPTVASAGARPRGRLSGGALRRAGRRRRPVVHGRRRRGGLRPRAQRRRQDDDRRDARGLPAAGGRVGAGPRPRPGGRPRRADAPHRRDAPGRRRLPGHPGGRGAAPLRRVLRRPRRPRPAPRPGRAPAASPAPCGARSRAASSNASRWRWPSSAGPRSPSSTSPPPASTWAAARSCGRSSPSWPTRAWPSS